jgi:TP901 family phage tail tape measure protein
MSEFVAGAFVDVRPDTKGFRDKLKTQVNASIKSAGVFKVPIEFEIKAFKKQLQDAARAAKPRIPIEIGGNVAELRKALNAKIKSASDGIKVKVPVEFQPAGAGSRGGTGGVGGTGGTGGRGRTGGAAGRQQLTEAEKQAIAVNKALDAAETKRIVTESMLASVTKQGLSVEERAQRLREARTAANAAVRTTTDALAKAEGNLSGAQKIALETAQRESLVLRQSVLAKEKAFKIDTARATLTIKNVAAIEGVNTVMAIEIGEVTTLNQLHIIENQLLAAEAALKRTTTKARQLEVASIIATNEAKLVEITRRKEAIIAQRLELKGEGKAITQRKTGLRGATSSLLSLLGIRGATLAASNAFLIGAASAAVFAKALGSFGGFERELNTFQAITGASAEEMEHASEVAKQLGEDIHLPSVSAADAAQSMTELARAGLSVVDSLNAARGVLELAAAAQIDNAEAATLVASGLNAFQLEGEEAVHVADLLANAANAAQGSISEMGAAMQQASAIANQVGISLDDTIGILTIFAQRGLRGSDAGTSFRTAMARLIAPTKKAAEVIDLLGLDIRDAQGNIRPEIFADFGEATKDLPPALRDMAAEIIAGQDSIRAFAIGASAGERGLQRVRLQMEQEGAAARVASARTKGLSGSFNALGSNVETLGITLGGFAAGPVQTTTQALTDMIGALNKLLAGDFSGFGESLQSGFDRANEGAERRIRSIGELARGALGDTDQLKKGLSDLFQAQPKEPTRVELLLEALNKFQTLRLQAFDVGINIEPITQQLKFLQGELKKAKIDAGLLIPVTPLEKAVFPLKQALALAKEIRDEALSASKGRPTDTTRDLDAVISQVKARIKVTIQGFKADAKEALSGKDLAKGFQQTFDLIAKAPELATPQILDGIDKMIRNISKVPVGSAPRALGGKVVKSIQTAINNAVDEDDPELAAAIFAKVKKIAALFGPAWAEAFKNIKVPLTADDVANTLLPEQIAGLRAEAFGTVTDQIAAKEAELAGLTAGLKGVRKNTEDEAQILQDIIGVQGEIKSLKEDAGSGADAILDAISGKEQRLLNQRSLAELTKTLDDDLKAERNLRAFYIKQIEIVSNTIKDKEKRNDAVADLKQKLFDLNLDISETVADRADHIFDEAAQAAEETVTLADDLRVALRRVRFWERQVKILEDLVKKRKATAEQLQAAQDKLEDAEKDAKTALQNRRQQRRENRQERFDLKIQIAQSNENVKAEIAAREAQIRNTKALIRQTRRGSLQRLRLIAQLRQEQQELRDLKKEKEKSAKEAQAVIFAFLQAQQGFAANLLSNLVPFHVADNALGAAGAGVPGVGGGGPKPTGPLSTASGIDPLTGRPIGESGQVTFPGEALAREATVQAATKPQQGFTNTQVTRLIALTAQMVSLLGGRVNKDSHPHARTQAKRSGGSADVE